MTTIDPALKQHMIELEDSTHSAETQVDPHAVQPELAHHFDSMPRQVSSAKLGMWLFLATELLLFGGLFCIYTVIRANNSGLFAWGADQLDVGLGAANTVVLIVSSFTMALAVTCVQLGRRWHAIFALSVTFLCGLIFMAVKSVEYEHKFHENLVWGVGFYEAPDGVGAGAGGSGLAPGDGALGLPRWIATCRGCHGVAGEGVTGQGKDIRSSLFIQERDDLELVEFIKIGRPKDHPLNETGIQMPAKGGNPFLTDQELMNIVAYIRDFQVLLEQENATDETEGDATPDDPVEGGDPPVEPEGDDASSSTPPEETQAPDPPIDGEFFVHQSSVPLAARGPAGLTLAALATRQTSTTSQESGADPNTPPNAHLFFNVYFLLTGLHGLHVLAGMIVISWLLFRLVWGHFGKTYMTPIDLGGLYWHIVDIIWIFLFPLLYLI